MVDEAIFKLIDPKGNDQFSNLNLDDRKELLDRLRRYSLTLRSTLGLKNKDTFGLELEFQHKARDSYFNIQDMMLDKGLFDAGWHLKPETSIYDGSEVTTPIFQDTKKCWDELDFVCRELQKDAKITELCGGHSHIGQQTLGSEKKSLLNLADLWVAYEPIIYRFGAGENNETRPRSFYWAGPLANLWGDELEKADFRKQTKEEVLDFLMNICPFPAVRLSKFEFQKVPTVEEDNTIEFRCPDATLDSVIWQNNVNLFSKLVECAENDTFDKDLLSEVRMETAKYAGTFNQYNCVHINEALTFADMIFNNNLDKVYFLKQYLKDTENGKSIVLKSKGR